MHLGNSIICPVTGIPMIIAAGCALFYSIKNVKKEHKKEDNLLWIALTALVFSLQMINFSIPHTHSSGHIIGAVLLAALLGPNRAFISMCTILTVQALFFNDGGLNALGCNIFNMGILACFIAYPFIYKNMNNKYSGAFLASVFAVLAGALAVVLEAVISGSVQHNISYFISLMLGIHFAIAVAEGVFTAVLTAVVSKFGHLQRTSIILFAVSILMGAFLYKYASTKPDGLEWSLLNISDSITAQTQGIIYTITSAIQAKTAVLMNINPVFANLSGIILVSVIMFLFIGFLKTKHYEQ